MIPLLRNLHKGVSVCVFVIELIYFSISVYGAVVLRKVFSVCVFSIVYMYGCHISVSYTYRVFIVLGAT